MRGKHFDRLESLCHFIIQEIAKMDDRMVYLDERIPELGHRAEFILESMISLDRHDSDLRECGFGGSRDDCSKDLRDDNNAPLNTDGRHRTEAYQEGREAAASGKGGNPWAGTPDNERWNDYESGRESYRNCHCHI